MAVEINLRRDTTANWTLANPILAVGEPAYDVVTKLIKVGDGVTPWVSLPSVTLPRPTMVYIESYFSTGRVAGVTDDTAALRAAIAASAGKTLSLGANTLKVTSTVEITSNMSVDARGSTINLIDDGTATGVSIWAHDFSGFTWTGGTLAQAAAGRTGVYGNLRLERVTNALVDGLTVNGGSSVGVFVIGGQFLTLRSITVLNTKADGIHISRGSSDVQIVSPVINNTGDDGIGIVAITTEPTNSALTYPVIKRVSVSDPLISGNSVAGGGVSFVGAQDCTLRGGIIDTVKTAGVKITNDNTAGAPQSAVNIVVSGTSVKNTVAGFLIGPSTDCQVVGGQVTSCSDSGVSINGSTRTLVSGGKFRGNAGFGFYEAAGTGNYIIGADIRGNTAGAFQASSATQVSCITA